MNRRRLASFSRLSLPFPGWPLEFRSPMTKRRRRGAHLERWLARAATPLFVLDAERRIAAFNAGCEALTGWTAAEVAGVKCHYGSVGDSAGVDALAASLCPPPEAFTGRELTAPAYLVHKEGRPLPRLLRFFPLRDEEDRLQGVLGIVRPLPPAEPAVEDSPARRLHAELAAARMSLRSRFGPNTLVARGIAMRKVLTQLALARQTSSPLLLVGEPGTGKEHLARAIHFSGEHRAEWFVPLDCRRLAADELDRVWTRLIELHRPASTGAAGPNPGTVFLEDVECLPRDLQERLVGVFASDESRPPPRLRLMSATTVDLDEAVARQTVRADFLALISPLSIEVPPLRERDADLPILAQGFLEDVNRQEEKQLAGFDGGVWPLFARYRWPGNLDELLAVVREAHARAADALIRVHDLPFRFRTALDSQESAPPPAPPPLPLDEMLTKVETRLIRLALERCRNNKSKAAEMLGIHRARLIRRVEQLRLGDETVAEESSEELRDLSAELMKEDARPE